MDLTQPVTAETFTALGVAPQEASLLASQHNIKAGRTGTAEDRAALGSFDNLPPPPKPVPAPLPSPAETTAALQAGTAQQYGDHLAEVYKAPTNAWDYRIPQAAGKITDEAAVADRALVSILHSDGTPLDIGNAVMRDLASGRQSPKSDEHRAALRPYVERILSAAAANPALAPYATPQAADLVLNMLSPETVAALLPYVQYRAKR